MTQQMPDKRLTYVCIFLSISAYYDGNSLKSEWNSNSRPPDHRDSLELSGGIKTHSTWSENLWNIVEQPKIE